MQLENENQPVHQFLHHIENNPTHHNLRKLKDFIMALADSLNAAITVMQALEAKLAASPTADSITPATQSIVSALDAETAKANALLNPTTPTTPPASTAPPTA
jgi:hypothetical protein